MFLVFLSIVCFFVFLGSLLIALRGLVDFVREIYLFYIAPKIGRSIDLKKRFGEWAIITGATAGIGKGYVLALAAKGLNIVLISRNEEKLKNVIYEVKQLYPNIELRYIVHNFNKQTDDKNLIKNSKELEAIDIGLLINNVGIVGEPFCQEFTALSLEAANEIIQVNCNSVIFMTKLILPKFVQKKKGAIVNVASISAFHPSSSMAVYNATKAFMDFFSRSIRIEMIPKGDITIQTIYPGFVKTNILPDRLKLQLNSFWAPEWKPFVKHAVETIGVLPETYGSLQHRFQVYLLSLIKLLPPEWGDRIVYILCQLRDSAAAYQSEKKSQ